MAGSIWVREIKRNKIVKDVVVPCKNRDWETALVAACRELDVAAPMVVKRHEKDFKEFRQVRFLPEHFMEHVGFDRMEVEYFDPEEKKG